MLDIIHRIDEQKKVTYVWFDTGLEYKATKDHLKYLEDRYGIEIHRERAIKPIPVCTREYGQPFLSKRVSDYISRLQRVGFTWEDKPFDELIEIYPKCRTGLRWWCNNWNDNLPKNNWGGDGKSKFNIEFNKYLKEFLISNPPTFKISMKCCDWAKKKVVHKIISDFNFDLHMVGVRKAEGGVRADAYKNCYTTGTDKVDSYRPLFWFKEEDKREYERAFDIKHSDCYCKWGFKRTGCCCCPYGRELFYELDIIKQFEPNMYKAVSNVFKESYEYTKQYRQFVREMNDKEKGRRKLF